MEVYRTEAGSLASLPLLDGDVHVWRASLRQSVDVMGDLQHTLSRDESERAARFYFSKDRDAFIVARGVLRSLLAGYLSVEPQQLTFGYEAAGKPFLADGFADQLFFNVSHSQDMALFAISHQPRTGIDIEFIRPITDVEILAANTFSANENAQLHSLPPHLILDGFFNCWTRKEAFVKALGAGVSYPLKNFDVALIPGEPARLLSLDCSETEAASWSMYALQPSAGYAAAIAVAGNRYSISHYEWTSSMSTSTL